MTPESRLTWGGCGEPRVRDSRLHWESQRALAKAIDASRADRMVEHVDDRGHGVYVTYTDALSAELSIRGMSAQDVEARFHPDGDRRMTPTKRILRGVL